MPWFFPWSESIKKRACRYLLQHYLGQFLQEKLTLDQLSVDLYNGTGTIKNLNLDVWSLNEHLEANNVPLELVDGFISSICVSIPWSALTNDNTVMEVTGLELTLQPKERVEAGPATPMFDSMMSMTSSLQLAQECLKQNTTDGEYQAEAAQPFEGLEMFAQTIESVLSRIKLTFVDTVIRVEHLPKDSALGVALEIRIKRFDYFDDLAADQGSSVDQASTNSRSIYEPAAVQHKNFHLMGVTFYCDQFPESHRTFSKTSSSSSSQSPTKLSPPVVSQQPALSSSPQAQQKDEDPIKVATLSGRQELKLKLKQKDSLPGPKLEIDCHLGAFNAFLSPKKVHILLDLANGLSSPGTCDNSNVKPRGSTNKPMLPDDYHRVEQELQRHLSASEEPESFLSTVSKFASGQWSNTPISNQDNYDEEYLYFSMSASNTGLTDMESSRSSQCSNSTFRSSSSASSLQYNYGVGYHFKPDSPFQAAIPKAARNLPSNKPRDPLQRLLDDPAAELTRYKVKLAFFSLTVLHEDPPTTPSDGIDPEVSSQTKLSNMSRKFFDETSRITLGGMAADVASLREQFSQACPHDHLCCVGKPLSLECNQKSSSSHTTLSVDLTVGVIEVIEALFDRINFTAASPYGFSLPIDNALPYYSEILVFETNTDNKRHDFSTLQQAASPCVKLRLHNYERNSQKTNRSLQLPKTDVRVELGKFKSELDVTIVDRINSLLNPEPLAKCSDGNFTRSFHPHMSRQSYFSQAIDEGSISSDRKYDINISSPNATLFVRFPIPDLRTGQVDRFPWWKRALRNETMILESSDASFHSSFSSSDVCQSFDITCRELHGLFQKKEDEAPVSFLRVSYGLVDDAAATDREDGFDWPRLVVHMLPKRGASVLEDPDIDSEDNTPHDSLDGACQFAKNKPEPSPFSTKRVLYENEEMVMPGDRQEMQEFQEKSLSNTRMSLEITAPNINILLPDRDFYELLYNRINSDLLLWEPQAPAPIDPQEQFAYSLPPYSVDLATQLMQPDALDERFIMCKSGIQYDSDSDSESNSGHYTIHDQYHKIRRKQRLEQMQCQSQLCVTLNIGHGKITVGLPLKDEEGKISTEKHGQLMLDVGDGMLFAVVSYNGDPDLQFVCIQANRAALFHNGNVDIVKEIPVIERASLARPSYLEPTIYPSEPGVYTKLSGSVGMGGDSLDMLSIAMKISMESFSNVKEFLVAVGARGATLHHVMTKPEFNWLNQIVEFLDVQDYPILGYTLPKVVTVMHTHLWSCCLDYRPVFLPLRTLVTVESFSVSSNIIANSDTSLLRFIVDDAALFLSEKYKAHGVDLKKNYVCVMDMGSFELSLITSDGNNSRHPKIDLRASNNIIHIRTCSDSMRALLQLVQYVASDGDLSDDIENLRDDSSSKSGQSRQNSLSSSPSMTQSQMEEMHSMMEDAMKESTCPSSASEKSTDDANSGRRDSVTEVYFFPDETQATVPADGSPSSPVTRQITAVMDESQDSFANSVLSDAFSDEEDEEEFCIIDDPGLGIGPRDGEPIVRMLSDEPIVIKENHFSIPLGTHNVLKAPEHFPQAVYRYTLREMSLVWHLYGGKDFSDVDRKNEKSKVNMYGTTRVTYGKSTPITTQRDSGGFGKLAWQARGGPDRDHNVLMELQMNKVRMQTEIYPDTTEQASRQIFLVNELEIRDRLVSSQINKFLYQYTSEAMPRQSHANMLLVKALHVRPDPQVPSQECSVKVSLMPLRLNIDQDALFFLKNFFASVTGETSASPVNIPCPSPEISSSPGKASSPPPVMTLGGPSPEHSYIDTQEQLIMFDEIAYALEEKDDELEEKTEEPTQPVYFKTFVFSPDVPIRLDYHGKRLDMGQGTIAGLLAGLAQLNCSELRLRRLNYRHGVLGVDRLMMHIINDWLQDIKTNQLPSILGGVGPMHSFVQLFQGIRDLFWLPIEQYKKDGRIVRGIQRGAHSFTTCTAMAALELTQRLVLSVQYAAEMAYDMVSPGPSVRLNRIKRYKRHCRLAQPSDIREGVSNAIMVVKEGVTGTADAIVKVATEEHELKGVTGAVGGVLRQIPPTVVQPLILVSEATSNVLGGMRNQLLPDAKKEQEEKWKQDESL
ncbi:autophagy-related protein 2 homolog B-like [Tubulanus polymorphus]|uniref:autophagy-related protein 2 homolog B-like n=1 Tax=Tubulanus polymorphus TaxID=672921 RepID=UPI003DA5A493